MLEMYAELGYEFVDYDEMPYSCEVSSYEVACESYEYCMEMPEYEFHYEVDEEAHEVHFWCEASECEE